MLVIKKLVSVALIVSSILPDTLHPKYLLVQLESEPMEVVKPEYFHNSSEIYPDGYLGKDGKFHEGDPENSDELVSHIPEDDNDDILQDEPSANEQEKQTIHPTTRMPARKAKKHRGNQGLKQLKGVSEDQPDILGEQNGYRTKKKIRTSELPKGKGCITAKGCLAVKDSERENLKGAAGRAWTSCTGWNRCGYYANFPCYTYYPGTYSTYCYFGTYYGK